MLIHNDFPILLQNSQDFAALSKIAWAWVDLDMNGSAYCPGISR